MGYQSKLPNGRLTTKVATIQTGADGIASFEHPLPDFIGKGTLSMRIDLGSATESLYGIPDKYLSLVAGLEDEINTKRINFEYSVVSKARSIPMAVLIVDADSSGAISIGTSSSALLQVLSQNGFVVRAAGMTADAISGKDDASVLAEARVTLRGKAERFAYGTTRVVSVKDDRGQKIVSVSAEVKVVELASGRILYSSIKQVPGVASSEKEAVEAARRQLGQKTLGEDLASSLP
ncbi:hypothetical protein MASR2M78_34380 [Treponema sp.]